MGGSKVKAAKGELTGIEPQEARDPKKKVKELEHAQKAEKSRNVTSGAVGKMRANLAILEKEYTPLQDETAEKQAAQIRELRGWGYGVAKALWQERCSGRTR